MKAFLLALLISTSANASSHEETKFGALPQPVQDKLLQLFNGAVPADSIDRFNPTDVVQQGKTSRLIVFAERHNSVYVIHYEHGGRGRHSHLVGIHYENESANPQFNVIIERCNSLAQANDALSHFAFSTAHEH